MLYSTSRHAKRFSIVIFFIATLALTVALAWLTLLSQAVSFLKVLYSMNSSLYLSNNINSFDLQIAANILRSRLAEIFLSEQDFKL